MSQQKHYTATDIERYRSGQLSAAEMHALEKAALDDPFLADALEGYTFTATQEKDVATLRQKLQLRIEKEDKHRGVFFLQTPWMRIAALFILIAGGGWLVFQTFSGKVDKAQEVATNQPVQRQHETLQVPSTTNADSIAVSRNETNNNQIVLNESARVQPQSSPGRKDFSANTTTAPVHTAPPTTLTAPVQSESRIQQMDAAEVYTLRKPIDTLIGGNTVASVKETDKLKLRGTTDTIKDLHIVLTPTGEEPETIVMNKSFSTKPQARRQHVVIDTLEPAEGWTRFDDYIANNIKTPDELKTKPMKGVVELSFDVNKEGEPVNITVVKSLCEKCDEEAIRLLKEGPKWKKNKKKGKVKIKF